MTGLSTPRLSIRKASASLPPRGIGPRESGTPALANLIGEPLRHEGEVYAATFDPKGERVATASADKTARVWDANPTPAAR